MSTIENIDIVEEARDAQRAALRDLVTLVNECSATEAEIDQRHTGVVFNINKEENHAQFLIEQRFKDAVEKIEREFTAKIEAAEKQAEAAKESLENSDRMTRSRISAEYSTIEKAARKDYEDAVWLAESTYDAVQIQVEAAIRAARELLALREQTISEKEAEALKLAQLYARTTPQVEMPPEIQGELPEWDGLIEEIDQCMRDYAQLRLPKMFTGLQPLLVMFLVLSLTTIGTFALYQSMTPQWAALGIANGIAFVVSLVAAVFFRKVADRHLRNAYIPLRQAIDFSHVAAQAYYKKSEEQQQEIQKKAAEKRDFEIHVAKDRRTPILARATRNLEMGTQAAQTEFARHTTWIESRLERSRQEANDFRKSHLDDLQQKYDADMKTARDRHNGRIATEQQFYDQQLTDLRKRWSSGFALIQEPMDEVGRTPFRPWSDTSFWENFSPPKAFASQVRFGQFQVDLAQITRRVPRHLALPPSFNVPAILGFPNHGSMIIHTDLDGHEQAIHALQNTMLRLLTSMPPGRVRFTLIDPIGLGKNFAAFMHLADYDEALVGGRIWTDAEHIDRQLLNLTEHMQTVIQKYLRNEFETIDDYNAQAGELAEPYRFLVIADLPVNFSQDSMRRLASILSSGPRCGVYALILRDSRQPLPQGTHREELEAFAVNLVQQGESFVWNDDVFIQFPLTTDSPPSEQFTTNLLHTVGKLAKEAKRVEVSFETIAPTPEKIWSMSTKDELVVPIGRLGATRLQHLKLGKGVAQHMLIAGKTGSGKSTLLHAMITNLAMWYSPDEIEFYLIDFKKGVEFKTYATHELPHARAVAVESDREFGLSVLQRLDAELTRRGELFRKLGVQDLPAFRNEQRSAPSTQHSALPRTLLIIDEFQEFFSEDDKLAQDASLLLDRLVRQGRAFGIHVLLGSQTIGGTSGLPRSTIGQMAVRVALQTSEADSQMILGDNNSAARLLSRPGEAIYNDAGGLVEANSPFQIAWLPDEQREKYLETIRSRAKGVLSSAQHAPAIIFEGNAPADITRNAKLLERVTTTTARAFIGDPVAIKDPTSIAFRRQSGANALIIGQHDEGALAIFASSLVSLAAQQPTAKFYLLDGTPADSTLAGRLAAISGVIPNEKQLVEWRGVADAMSEITDELHRRQEADATDAPPIYLFIFALQRYRMLRKTEESFSFSGSDEEKAPSPDKLFPEILREGPALGIHTIVWADTAATLDRTFERQSMREFDHRVLFQMSANDSSLLIDSPTANRLGFNRALLFSEEHGTIEKFRPYALPEQTWLNQVARSLNKTP